MRRDDPDAFVVDPVAELPASVDAILEALAPVVTPARLARMHRVASMRTDRVAIVLDGITDPHNGSAVLRSADAFGVQNVHVIEIEQPFRAAHRVARGTNRWIDVHRHDDAAGCVRTMKELGYEIFVAAMDGEHTPTGLRDRPKVAVVFGNEHRGASEAVHSGADGTFAIPMVGFVESLNVSVAAAVTLHALRAGREGDLSDEDRRRLVARFLLRSVKDAERIVREHVG